MASGDISWSGKALRAVVWRAPLRAAKYTTAGFMATGQEVGTRWVAMAGLGLWVWLLWGVALWLGVQGFLEFTSFLLLLWIWRLVVLIRWTISLRVAAARARAMQRQQLKILTELPGQLQQVARQIPIPTGGLYSVAGMGKHQDPEYAAQQQKAREEAEGMREWVPDQDLPVQDVPVMWMPKWIRKRRPR